MKLRVKQAEDESWHIQLQWLQPGLGVKRWLGLLALGVGLISLGGALVLRAQYPRPAYFYYITLQFLPHPLRVALFLFVGLGCIVWSLWGINRAILAPFVKGTSRPLPELLLAYRRRGRGPKIVVIGGGHGQATLLRGLKPYTTNLTAIVTVGDDGGSSGRLRRDLGILPPGDFRNCIAALADDEALMTRLFQYRFAGGKTLAGHSFGNLFISAMAGVTGSFEAALKESSKVLAVQGQVLPSTLQAVTLCADVQEGDQPPVRVRGESHIPEADGQITRLSLDPAAPMAYPEAIRAILEADLVVAGPGSLYTSILANLLVPDIAQALRATRATTLYVCNIATQRGETEGYTAEEHIAALEKHLGPGMFSVALINQRYPETSLPQGIEWVAPEVTARPGLQVIRTDLADDQFGWRHASDKVARAVMALLKHTDLR